MSHRQRDAEDTGPVVCPNCLAENSTLEHFCHQCGAPLTSHAVTDPMGQVYSEGDTFRKAIEYPRKPIVVVGMWLIWVIIYLANTTHQ
jgi:predicted amidophosphoribosyltransferase